jgi:hypothetical protein
MSYEIGKAVVAAVVPYLGGAITSEQVFEVAISGERVEIRYGVKTPDEKVNHRLAVIDPETSTVLYDHEIGAAR